MTRAVFLGCGPSVFRHGVTTRAAALWFAAFALLSAMGACAAPGARGRYEYERPQMGTVFRVVMYAPSQGAADAAAEAAFARVDELNKTMSDYEPESELNRLSRTAGAGRAVTV